MRLSGQAFALGARRSGSLDLWCMFATIAAIRSRGNRW